MTDEASEEPEEYRREKAALLAYWKRIKDGLRSGDENDVAVGVARLAKQFGAIAVEMAIRGYIDNSLSAFEERWRERWELDERKQQEAVRRARNPRGAGRKSKRSNHVLMAAWLVVEKCMRAKNLDAKSACEVLAKSPTRRGAATWPGLALYSDSTKASADTYYVKTPGNLRDIYNEAITLLNNGPESLRRHWQTVLSQSFLARVRRN